MSHQQSDKTIPICYPFKKTEFYYLQLRGNHSTIDFDFYNIHLIEFNTCFLHDRQK